LDDDKNNLKRSILEAERKLVWIKTLGNYPEWTSVLRES